MIIRRGHYLRGREEGEMRDLIQDGIKENGREPEVQLIPESRDAIEYAIKNGQKGELIVTLADVVATDMEIVDELRDEYVKSQAV